MDKNKAQSCRDTAEDPDIVKMDFPPYVEEYPPLPDVETDFNFEDNKEEIYRRNRIIAAETQLAILKEENRQKLEKYKQFREMTKTTASANAANVKNYWDKLVLPVSLITVFAIVLLIVVLSGRLSEPHMHDYSPYETAEQAFSSIMFEMESLRFEEEMKEAETVLDKAATQVSKEPSFAGTEEVITEESLAETVESEAEADNEILKTTAVREPFEASESVTVANTDTISCKIENPRLYAVAKEQEYNYIPGSVSVSVDITIKNLTDYDYAVKMSLFSMDGMDIYEYKYLDIKYSGYDESLAEYDDDGELIWLHFDENNICRFTMTLSGYSYDKKSLFISYAFGDMYDQYFQSEREKNPSNPYYMYDPPFGEIRESIDIPYESRTVIIEE